jgi:molybdate transport system substrate-binding protein
VVAVAAALAGCTADAPRVSVGAAASLRFAMPELAEAFRAETGIHIDAAYAASDRLAAGVAGGAVFDAVVLVDAALLDELAARDALASGSRREVGTNTIVLIGPAGSHQTFPGLAVAHRAQIAIGDPAAVPVGRHARAYLQAIGAWDAVQGRTVLGGDVAGVVALAKQGAARYAIVYRTDAARAAPLVVLDEPADTPIVAVEAAVVAASRRSGAANRFVGFLGSPKGQAILGKHGFGPAR